ncbi:FUSC family protein [Flavobacterium ardleyense]|uniref:FUSC family protein n=1 Tax=Flavobacterium ardleyense TaxID=2038737 RepID=UPI00298C24A4|nr:FUSC family membrane protein [Flavobacterium ardleyense]
MVFNLRQFAESINFANAIKVTIATVIPILIASHFDQFDIGITIAIGALLTYPSDISSNLQHKINGILVGTSIVSGTALIISLAHPYPWLFYSMLTLLIFFLSMISVYGHRANLVSFCGLLSISLIFKEVYSGIELLEHCALMLAGGLFYLLISIIFYYLRPHKYAELLLADSLELTAKYMELRGDLWKKKDNKVDIVKRQLELQVKLNASHEDLREALMHRRANSGSSGQNRTMLIMFITLVDILELALATSFDHERLNKKFSKHPEILNNYQTVAYNLAAMLNELSISLSTNKTYVKKFDLYKDLTALEEAQRKYESLPETEKDFSAILMLTSMLRYAEKQIEKLTLIERAYTQKSFKYEFKDGAKNLHKFIAPQYYSPSTLIENLTFSSTYFRHALRLTIAIMVGFLIGTFLPFQNVYWILITIIVILRPGYGLTKTRSYHRIIGTVLGGLMAFGLLFIVQNNQIIATMAIVTMILAFSFVQTNYKVAATFTTMYVVFIYSLFTPDIRDVVEFRIIDTFVGAALAFGANYFLWPSWEFLNTPVYLKKSIEANKNYLKEIFLIYNTKQPATLQYRLARKHAFVALANLMESFQRMVQEPKSKQKQLPKIYKLTTLNHSLLSSAASLGTYIQANKTTKASEAFNVVVNATIRNLEIAIDEFDKESVETFETEDLSPRFTELKNIRAKELSESNDINDEEIREKMLEAQLIIEQLMWMTNASEKIKKTVKALP